MSKELNYKSTFDCTVYYHVTGIAIFKHTILYLYACCCNEVKVVLKSQFLKKTFRICNWLVLIIYLLFIQVVSVRIN